MNLRKTTIDFGRKVRPWDGFGINYVETCQTIDYEKNPQDYGGFSTLDTGKQEEILDLMFGDDGLKPGLVKMFLDPLHQTTPAHQPPGTDAGNYDHARTTGNMCRFVEGGLARTRQRGDTLDILATLYGPPQWATLKKTFRGRELDESMFDELASYCASFVHWCTQEKNYPVRHFSIHNEGEDWLHWPENSINPEPEIKNGLIHGWDYNGYWTPQQVARFLPVMRAALDRAGCTGVGVTPGEPASWTRFADWGYADAILANPAALEALGCITSHSFFNPVNPFFFGDWRSTGIDMIREERPELHAWVGSTSWYEMRETFIWKLINSLHASKVNGSIQWATIQQPDLWSGGDPNPGCAIIVDGAGDYTVTNGYHFFKGLCRAGQAGTHLVRSSSNDTGIAVAAFSGEGSPHPDAFTIASVKRPERIPLTIHNSRHASFAMYVTRENEPFTYRKSVSPVNDILELELEPYSVTTFFGE